MSSQLFSSYNPLTFHPPPHLLQNKEAELESPLQQADSVGKRGNKTVPWKAPLWRTKHCKKHNGSSSSAAAPGLEDGHERAVIPVAACAFIVENLKFETYQIATLIFKNCAKNARTIYYWGECTEHL